MRKTATLPLAATALLLPALAPAQTGELLVIKETGPRDKRVNMVITGDGYTAADKEKFKTHLQTVVDAILKDAPLWDYADYFNVYAIFVASNQTGADNPSTGTVRDTYFGANYVNGSRLLVIDDRKAMPVFNKYLPEADMRFIIVNSEMYGGSGGQVAVANYTSPEIIAHEAQHSFSGLGDEYDYAGVSPWEAPNTTQKTSRNEIRWNHWISAATPVPTPETPAYDKVPGLFEGAAYNATGWYRPKQNCRMRENGAPFCEVCTETVLLSMYDKVSPLDSALPATRLVSVQLDQTPPLRIRIKKPLFHDLAVTWSVDGTVQTDLNGTAFTKTLAAGLHKVAAVVKDTSRLVRKDPGNLLSDTASWQVSVGSVSGIDADAEGRLAENIRADAKQWIVRLRAMVPIGAAGIFHLRLVKADGTLMDDRFVENGSDGTLRVHWNRVLEAGAYVAELERGGKSFRQRFTVPR
jgi:hypothetical protein